MSRITYRHPTDADLVTITAIWNDSLRDSPDHKTLTIQEVKAELFDDKDYDTEGAWLAYDGELPVAYFDGFVDKTRNEFGKNDGFVGLNVIHSARDMDLEGEMIQMALAYLRRRGMAGAQGWAHSCDTWKSVALEKAGFRATRKFYLMKRTGRGATEAPRFPDGIGIEHCLVTGEDDAAIRRIVEIRNESFVDHFNFSPATFDRWKAMVQSTEEVFRATFASSQGKVAGFVLSQDRIMYSKEAGIREGWIATLGVAKPSRRKGLGRALLLDGIDWLTERGVELIRLGVDAENSKALDLYRSVGFDVEQEATFFLKDLA